MKYLLFGEMPPARGEPDTRPEERVEAQELRKNEEKYGKARAPPIE
jgi:hypothetical protein